MGVLWRWNGFHVSVPLGGHILRTSVLRCVRPEHRCHVSKTRCWRADSLALLCDYPASHILRFDGSPRSAVRFVEVSLGLYVAGNSDPDTIAIGAGKFCRIRYTRN
jgi:hypothetical protein